GTTPMDARDDALVAAAEFVLRVRAAARDGAVATVGRLAVEPGATNVVPARVTVSVDARASRSPELDRLVAEIGFEPAWRTEPIHSDGYRPGMVLAIARGGLLVAGALAYALGVKNTFTMSVEFYTGIDERLEMPMILPPVPVLVDFAETRVLIADDVADTGAT